MASSMDHMKGANTSSPSSKVQFPLHIGIGTTLPHMMSKVQSHTLRRPKSKKSQMWWSDNHAGSKNSKFIQENLEEMDYNVKRMMKLIEEEDVDFSPKKKPGKHGQKRPELIHLVDEFSRMYRSLAERYDHGEVRRNIHSDLLSQGSGGLMDPDFFQGPGGNTTDESSYVEYSESESDESSVANSSTVVHPNEDEHKILALEEELKNSKEKLLDSQNEVERLMEEVKKIQESEQASKVQLETVMDQALEWKAKVDKGVSELADRDQEIMRLKEERDNSEKSLSEIKSYHQEKVTQLKKEKSYLEKKINEMDEWFQSLGEDVRQLQAEKSVLEASLRADIEQLQIIVSKKTDQLNEITQDYDTLMDEKDKLNARVEQFVMEVKNKDDHLKAIHLECVNMNVEITGSRKMVDKMRSRVEELEEKVAKQQESILEGAEEKREAIRQLCFSLEHYRVGYQELRESIINHKRSFAKAT